MDRTAAPTKRKTVTLPCGLWAEIAEFRFAQHVATEAEAVRLLIQSGLRAPAWAGHAEGRKRDAG
ncbi:MAG: hypothetical protein NVSMB18_36990 [Acetobacteraceae bacterium]